MARATTRYDRSTTMASEPVTITFPQYVMTVVSRDPFVTNHTMQLKTVTLQCPSCKGTVFSIEYHGYAWYSASLKTEDPLLGLSSRISEGDTEVGDDFDPSDNGWVCSDCFEQAGRDLDDALTFYYECCQSPTTAHIRLLDSYWHMVRETSVKDARVRLMNGLTALLKMRGGV